MIFITKKHFFRYFCTRIDRFKVDGVLVLVFKSTKSQSSRDIEDFDRCSVIIDEDIYWGCRILSVEYNNGSYTIRVEL